MSSFCLGLKGYVGIPPNDFGWERAFQIKRTAKSQRREGLQGVASGLVWLGSGRAGVILEAVNKGHLRAGGGGGGGGGRSPSDKPLEAMQGF